jgi:hypothetical protein
MEQNYSKREIDMIIKEIHEDVKAILEQTKKTNGRVNSLEIWRGYITGGLAILGVMVGYIIKFIN